MMPWPDMAMAAGGYRFVFYPYCASDPDAAAKAGFDVPRCVIGAGVYALDLLMSARYFKRIGDHGTNIHKACR